MRITLHQLTVFKTVARLKSITLAAHELHMTQPAVSNIVRQLEDSFDCKLTEVIAKKLSLTHFGESVLRACQDIEHTLEATRMHIAQLKGGLTGTITVATVSTARYFVPHLLGLFKETYPDIHIKLTVCNRHEILLRLTENKDDFVIMSHPPRSIPVDLADFYDDELVIAKHPTVHLDNSLDCLKNAPWIIREQGSGTRYAADELFKQLKITPRVEMEIGDSEAIKQAIIAKIGVAVISKQSIKNELEYGLIDTTKVNPFPVKHTWYLVKHKGKTLSPIAEAFYTFVHKHKPVFTDIY